MYAMHYVIHVYVCSPPLTPSPPPLGIYPPPGIKIEMCILPPSGCPCCAGVCTTTPLPPLGTPSEYLKEIYPSELLARRC